MAKTRRPSFADSLDVELALLQRRRGLIQRVDRVTVRLGRKLFASDLDFARWLATPQAVLGGRIALDLLVSRLGRQEVQGVLRLAGDGFGPKNAALVCAETASARPKRAVRGKTPPEPRSCTTTPNFIEYLRSIPKDAGDGSVAKRQ